MTRRRKAGFRYFLSDELLEQYQKKPVALRLQWLYMANVLRKGYSKRTIRIQDGFRQGKMWRGRGGRDVMQAAKIKGVEL